jgi:hypothetical protein
MARPQVADGGDSLQVWRVAANILNKQSQTADKWSLGGRGVVVVKDAYTHTPNYKVNTIHFLPVPPQTPTTSPAQHIYESCSAQSLNRNKEH